MNKNDKRWIKTERGIREAMVKLLRIKHLDQITVSEICEDAFISRNAFYSHYESVYDLMEKMENEKLEKITGIIEASDIADILTNPYALVEEIAKITFSEFEVYKEVFNSQATDKILDRIRENSRSEKIDHLVEEMGLSDEEITVIIEFVASGTFGAYRYWLNSDRETSLEVMFSNITTLLAKGLEGLFVRNN